jgi:hypothetical protein
MEGPLTQQGHAGAPFGRRRLAVVVLIVGGVLMVGGMFALRGSMRVLWIGVPALGVLVWQCARCRHAQPLGLLPPIVDAQGARVPSRWYCADCGGMWPAVFDHGHAPILRFAGFDQSKAPAAAKRAHELEDGLRLLAIKRSGMSRPVVPHKIQLKPAVRAKGPVAVPSRRIVG